MDLNIAIIDGVRELKPLHDNSCNLEERNRAWMQLAEKLKINAQILRIRWHRLLQEYQRDDNSKYANKMNFVRRTTESKSEDNWPEFIITEECLKEEKTEEQEQFVFLEREEEDNNSKCSKSSKENEHHSNSKTKETEKSSNKTPKNEDRAEADEKKEIEKSKETREENVKKSQKPNITTSNIEEKIAIVDLTKNESVTNNNVAYEKPQPPVPERCEDVIFGELVSAMLKRMDEDKKKNIKREIMNLLFS